MWVKPSWCPCFVHWHVTLVCQSLTLKPHMEHTFWFAYHFVLFVYILRGGVVLAAFLPERTGLTVYLSLMVWAPVDCLYCVWVCAHHDCVHCRVLQCIHALQIAGVYCSTLVDSEVMLGVGRSVVGREQFDAVSPLPQHLGRNLPKTS